MRHQVCPFVFALVVILCAPATGAAADTGGSSLVSVRAATAPRVDGNGSDVQWEAAPALVTTDRIAGIDITLRSVFTDEEVFFLVTFPDETENRGHKTLVWEDEKKIYVTGPTREDTFVFKWNMEPLPVDLSLSSDDPYKADIWYWKSNRTDHAGHADDKYHMYGPLEMSSSKRLISKSGRVFFLLREGDEGEAAYQVLVREKFMGSTAVKYEYGTPSGSRADIRARGVWSQGGWTVEFGRRLDTGHPDDVALDTKYSYQFVVSRYEIAGRKADPSLEEPFFGSGEGGEIITLSFR